MLKHFYHCSDDEIKQMSMYKVQQYLNNLPKLLGTDKQEQQKPQSHQELVSQARNKGLKVPRHFKH